MIAIKRYEKHPSIEKIKNTAHQIFSFKHVSIDEVKKEIMNLDHTNASQENDIPVKLLKANADIICGIIVTDFNNNLIVKGLFPESLKTANVTPVYKKDSRTDKTNYRPVSILPNLSKVYEQLIYNQLSNFFENKLSKFQCGFRKGYNAQDCLLVMIEKWKRMLDKGGTCGALLTDLSKAFDCLPHDLLLAKLHGYGIDLKSLKLLSNYLTRRKQRVRMGNFYSSWFDILAGVPQGSIIGPLLFNIFMSDLFLFFDNIDIANYAVDSTPYLYHMDSTKIGENLENISAKLLTWFTNNRMKANPDKYHFLLTGGNEQTIYINEVAINSSKEEKLLGITIDNKLNFHTHTKKMCNKVNQKLNAFTRIANFINPDQRRIIMKPFITSQFGYCPRVWMFHSKQTNNRINRLHERSPRITYNDYHSSFQDLLNKDKSVSIHKINLQVFATLLYKVINNLSPQIIRETFYNYNQPKHKLRMNPI